MEFVFMINAHVLLFLGDLQAMLMKVLMQDAPFQIL